MGDVLRASRKERAGDDHVPGEGEGGPRIVPVARAGARTMVEGTIRPCECGKTREDMKESFSHLFTSLRKRTVL
jgi:hypothetical protein